MSAYSRPCAFNWPDLSAEWVQRWAQKTQDLVLLLDGRDCVAGAVHDGAFAADDVHHWIGQRLLDVVSPDTRHKIDMLLTNDAARDDADDRWRHINLVGVDGAIRPVLTRYMQLPDAGQPTRTVICRDLRSSQVLNQRYLTAHREIEQTVLDLRETIRAKDQELQTLRAATLDVVRLVDQIRRGGFDQVIGQATRILQRQCLQMLLDQAGGDPQRAARLAGVDAASWAQRAQAAGL